MHLPQTRKTVAILAILLLVGTAYAAITMFVQTNQITVNVTPLITVTQVQELENTPLASANNPSMGTACTQQADGQTWNCPTINAYGGDTTILAFWITGGSPFTPTLTYTLGNGITPTPTEQTDYGVCTNSYGTCYFNSGIQTGMPAITTGEWVVIFVTITYAPSTTGTGNLYVSLGK
jgi:hypothetical protein